MPPDPPSKERLRRSLVRIINWSHPPVKNPGYGPAEYAFSWELVGGKIAFCPQSQWQRVQQKLCSLTRSWPLYSLRRSRVYTPRVCFLRTFFFLRNLIQRFHLLLSHKMNNQISSLQWAPFTSINLSAMKIEKVPTGSKAGVVSLWMR